VPVQPHEVADDLRIRPAIEPVVRRTDPSEDLTQRRMDRPAARSRRGQQRSVNVEKHELAHPCNI
jgi:hypothetical protein